MSEANNQNQCQTELGTLKDFILGELQLAKSLEIEEHIKTCEDCASGIAALKKDAEYLALTEIEPSKDFRSSLMKRVRSASAAHSGSASKRLEKMILRHNNATAWFRPAWKIGVFAVSAAACLLVAVFVDITPDAENPHNHSIKVASNKDKKAAELAEFSRYHTRKRATKTQITKADERIQLDGYAQNEEVVVTGIYNNSNNEKCLMAFRSGEWTEYVAKHRKFSSNAKETARLNTLESTSQVIPVIDGHITIPKELMRFVGTRTITVVNLASHTELWDASNYESYSNTMPAVTVPTSHL